MAADVWNKLDINKDGFVTLEEFTTVNNQEAVTNGWPAPTPAEIL